MARLTKSIFITRKKLEQLQADLGRIKGTNTGLAEELRTEFATGTFHDNAPWEVLRDQQSGINGQIEEIGAIVANHTIIDDLDIDESVVGIGTIVTFKNMPEGTFETFTILGPYDSEPCGGIISHMAPLIQPLMGKRVGFEGTFQLKKMLIVDIKRWKEESK